MAHNYTNTASRATLDAPLNSSSQTFGVAGFTGYPSVPFYALIDRDTSSAELVEVTNVAGTTLTANRGAGGTASTSHSAGGTVEHVIPAAVPQAVEQHVEATSNIHGVTGALIGADSTGTLANKTFRGAHRHDYSDTEPAAPNGGFVVNADNSLGRDGFVANNTGANTDRSGFALRQSGSDRFLVYYDGTVKVNPSGVSGRPAVKVTGNVESDDLSALDDITAGGDITAIGNVEAAAGNFGNVNVSGGLSSTGTNAMGVVNAAGKITASASGTGLTVNNTAEVGTLNVLSGNAVLQGTNARLQFPSSASGSGTAAGQARYRGGQLESWDGSSWRGTMAAPVSTTGGFSGTTSTNNRVLIQTPATDPGYPYFLMVSGQAEFNGVANDGTRWDLVICLDSASNTDFLATAVGNGFVQTSAASNILTGTHDVYWVARRTLGGSSVTVSGFNQLFSVVQVAAVIRPT
jgi:hypothetical protein